MDKLKAIFIFDYTGIMSKPWLDAGYECWCFDSQHPKGITKINNYIKVGMYIEANSKLLYAKKIVDLVGDNVSFVFGFPECTDLTVAGAKHFNKKSKFNRMFQLESIELADLIRCIGVLTNSPWGFENPVSVISSQYRKPDFIFNPRDFGGYLPREDKHPLYPKIYPPRDAYNKNTCLWYGNGFKKPKILKVKSLIKDNPGWKKCGGKSIKTKNIRSATPRGFSIATFEANKREEQS